MTEKNQKTDKCRHCGDIVIFDHLGLVPNYFISETADNNILVDTYICSNCGALTPNTVTDDQIEEYEDKYIDYLVDNDMVKGETITDIKNGT